MARTSAESESAETYTTRLTQPVISETGIIAIQKIVNQPFTRRMKTGSPWTEAQMLLATPIVPRSPARDPSRRNSSEHPG
jgi:hypothetical protein